MTEPLPPDFQARLNAYRRAGDRRRYDALLRAGIASLELEEWQPDPMRMLWGAAREAVYWWLKRRRDP